MISWMQLRWWSLPYDSCHILPTDQWQIIAEGQTDDSVQHAHNYQCHQPFSVTTELRHVSFEA